MEEERDDLDNYMLEIVDLILDDRLGVTCDKFWEMEIHRTRDTREKRSLSIEKQKTLSEEGGPVTSIFMCRNLKWGQGLNL